MLYCFVAPATSSGAVIQGIKVNTKKDKPLDKEMRKYPLYVYIFGFNVHVWAVNHQKPEVHRSPLDVSPDLCMLHCYKNISHAKILRKNDRLQSP